MTKIWLVLVVLVLAVAGEATPAVAGSEEDPEIQTQNCDPGVIQIFGEYTICKAWFESDPADAQSPRFRTTVQVAEGLSGRVTPLRIGLSWLRADRCRESWRLSDAVDRSTQVEMLRECPNAPTVVRILPTERVVLEGTTASLEITREDLVGIGSDLAWGDRLAAPIAATRFVVETPGDGFEFTSLGSSTEPGRDFVLPSRPDGA